MFLSIILCHIVKCTNKFNNSPEDLYKVSSAWLKSVGVHLCVCVCVCLHACVRVWERGSQTPIQRYKYALIWQSLCFLNICHIAIILKERKNVKKFFALENTTQAKCKTFLCSLVYGHDSNYVIQITTKTKENYTR